MLYSEKFLSSFCSDKENNEMFYAAMDTMNMAMLLADSGGNLIDMNKSALDLYGIVDKRAFMEFNPNLIDSRCYGSPFKPGQIPSIDIDTTGYFDYEQLQLCFPGISYKTGREIHQVSSHLICDSNENLRYIIMFVKNLSEEGNDRNKFIFSGDNRRFSMDMAGITSWLYDIKSGRRIYDAGPHFFPEQDSMEDFIAMLSREDAHALRVAITLITSGNQPSGNVILNIADKNNPDRLLCLDMFLTANGVGETITKIYILTKDVTLRKTNERKAKLAEFKLNAEKEKANGAFALLNTIIDIMPCLFFAKDIDNDFRYYMANLKYCEQLGKKASEVIRHTDKDLFHKKEADCFLQSDIKAIDRGTFSLKEETNIGGVRKLWHTQKFYIEIPNNIRLVVGMSIDVTEIYQSYENAEKARIEAERSDKMKSLFIQNVYHELVTPLNSILGFSRLLINTKDIEDKKYLDKEILENGRLLNNILEGIIDLTKIEAGVENIKEETFDLSGYIADIKDSYASLVRENVEFKVEIPHEKCIVTLDKKYLSKIISRGIIDSIRTTYQGHITLGYECIPNGVAIYVENTGIGLTEEELFIITEKYEDINEYTEGFAFSLALSKILIKIMGGEIKFTSVKGEITKTQVWLPTDTIIK